MCPVCLSSIAWLITGGVSVLGAAAGGAAIIRDGKIRAQLFLKKDKGEITWQQAKTMTRTTR